MPAAGSGPRRGRPSRAAGQPRHREARSRGVRQCVGRSGPARRSAGRGALTADDRDPLTVAHTRGEVLVEVADRGAERREHRDLLRGRALQQFHQRSELRIGCRVQFGERVADRGETTLVCRHGVAVGGVELPAGRTESVASSCCSTQAASPASSASPAAAARSCSRESTSPWPHARRTRRALRASPRPCPGTRASTTRSA